MEQPGAGRPRLPARRRSDEPVGPQQLFDEVLLSPLHWPGKTVRLERDSARDYRQRPMSAQVSIAELYHENSKLFPALLPELAATRTSADAFRREFVRRRAIVAGASGSERAAVVGPRRGLLGDVARAVDPELFYAVELRLVVGDAVAAYEPIGDLLQVVKRLTPSERGRLRQALAALAPPDQPNEGTPLVLVGCFARNEVLFGARGYRRTLLEAGRVAQEVVRGAARRGVAARPVYEFVDRELDEVLEADGVEQGCVMAFELGDDAG